MRNTRRAKSIAIAIGTIIGGVTGCDVDLQALMGRPGNTDNSSPASKRLIRFESAEELGAYFTEQSKNAQSRGDGVFFFDEDASDGALDAAPAPNGGSGADAAPTAAGDDNGASTQESGDSGGNGYSTTTQQEAGVQESDVIKNDGEYLYVLSRNNLRIVKATPVEEMAELSSVDLRGYGYDMYLTDDRVTVITTPSFDRVAFGDGPKPVDGATDELIASSYFYQPRAEITVIDVADRSNPVVLSRTQLDGNVNSSRMIDGRLYLVMVHYPDFLPQFGGGIDVLIDPVPDVSTTSNDGDVASSDDLAGEAGVDPARSAQTGEVSSVIPNIKVEVNGEQVVDADVASPTDFYRPADPDGWGLTTVVSFDIATPTEYQAQSIVGYPANAYMSTEALYLTNTDYGFDGTMRETTDIYKFSVVEGGTELAATGSVPGRVLNQYSMSEHNGFLRLASTVGPTFSRFGQNTSESKNNVYVLEQVDDALTVAGSVEGLAPGESIQSARFLGDRGFVVTFVQIDPLFTLDLSDPRNPQVVGELKVPGFSTFITPMGENHLLTIGRDTNDEFGFVRSDGIRVSIFDVTDFANPTLAHVEVIGGGAYSEALFNPKAFTYFAERNLLAFPVEIYGYTDVFVDFDDTGLVDEDGGGQTMGDSGGGGAASSGGTEGSTGGDDMPSISDPLPPANPVDTDTPPGEPTPVAGPPEDGVDVDVIDLPGRPDDFFYGLYVYEVTPEGGFTSMGKISTAPDNNYYYGSAFSRGVFIGDYVYAATSETIKAALVGDADTVVADVNFPVEEFFNESDGFEGDTFDAADGAPVPAPEPN